MQWRRVAASNGRALQRMMELARSLGGRCEIGTIGKKVEKAVASCEYGGKVTDINYGEGRQVS